MSHFDFINTNGHGIKPGSYIPAPVPSSREVVAQPIQPTEADGTIQHIEGSWDRVSQVFRNVAITTFQTKPTAAPNRGALIPLGDTRLCCTSREASTVTCATIPAGYVVLVIPLNKPCRHVINGRKLEPNTFVVCGPQADYISRDAPGKKSCVLAFSVAAARQAFVAVSGGEMPEMAAECKILKPAPGALRTLEQTAADIAACARNAPDLFRCHNARLAMEQSLLAAAVRAWVSAEVASTRHARASACVTSICQRANSYLQEHQGQPVYIADICAALGITDRCLNLAFQNGFGIGPIAYLRLRRLRQAHAQLQADSPKSNLVKAIAYDAGFGDLGRFAAYYRQAFGELPHETLQRRAGHDGCHGWHGNRAEQRCDYGSGGRRGLMDNSLKK